MVIFKIFNTLIQFGWVLIMGLLDLDCHIMAAGSQMSLSYPTVTCCCGLPTDYSNCSVLYLSLSVLCFVGGCTYNSYSVCRVCHPERTVQ